jgi:hypothetical protein
MVPTKLCSPTLATLYMRQGHEEDAITVLEALEAKKVARQTEFLTRLLMQVTMKRHDLQGHPDGNLHRAA